VNAGDLIAALELPVAARVDQRIPKKLLVEHGAPTAADKRRINDGIEELQWLAALKPTTVGVSVYRDSVREYLEIAVLNAVLRTGAKAQRLASLIHRAVPYPVVLVATDRSSVTMSLVHKRWSQAEAGATVLDGELVEAEVATHEFDMFDSALRAALPLSHQPRVHLHALYQGWMDTVVALLAARVTGVFTSAESPEHAVARREAILECARLDMEVTRMRAAAAKERQVARQVELNLKLQRVEQQRAAARRKL
jgi:hypothetical protein